MLKLSLKNIFTTAPRFWITGFTPVSVPGTVHHMAVAGCSSRPPSSPNNVWNCGANGNPVLEPQYPSFVVTQTTFLTHQPHHLYCRPVLRGTSSPPPCSSGPRMGPPTHSLRILVSLLEGILSTSTSSCRYVKSCWLERKYKYWQFLWF